ncbi:MAG: hypothetical protein QG635_1850, partial [Bacteroidota bacterium]|nr:hypothetical protein [Bacteroidota bacterium]
VCSSDLLVSGYAIKDINIAVRQLRYVAETADLDYINEIDNPSEKLKRFELYWKKLDPSPGTERNEAFDEYYARIDFVNKNFKTYSDGWLSDRGAVYIVYGPPYNVDRYSNYGDGRVAERWTYSSGRQFVFVDNTGFGDYRLVQPMSITDKYKYNR